MPTIPLIANTQPLKDIPDPVLDRERRPSVDYSGIMQGMAEMTAASRMPEMRPDALSAPYEAMETIGRAVAQAGNLTGAVAMKRMEAESEVQVSRAQAALQQTRADFEKWRLENPDHTLWLPEWERRMGQARTQILEDPKLHNLAYNALLPQLTSYESSSKIDVDLLATKKAFAEAGDMIAGTARTAALNQNREDYVAARRKLVGGGYATEAQASELDAYYDDITAQRRSQAAANAQRNEKLRIETEMKANPGEFAKKTTDPRLREMAEKMDLKQQADAINFGHNWIAYNSEVVPGDLDERAQVFRWTGMLDKQKERLAERDTIDRPQFMRREDAELDQIKKRIAIDKTIDSLTPEDRKDIKRFEDLSWRITSTLENRDAELARKRLYFAFGIEAPKGPDTPGWDATIAEIGSKFFDKRKGVHPYDVYVNDDFSGTVERSISVGRMNEATDMQAKYEANMRRNADKDVALRDPVSLANESFKFLKPEQQLFILRQMQGGPGAPPVSAWDGREERVSTKATPEQQKSQVNTLQGFNIGMNAAPRNE